LLKKTKKEELAEFLSSDLWVELNGLPEDCDPIFKTVIPLPEGRTQLAYMELNDYFFQLSSPFADQGELAAERAFRVNETLFGLEIKFGCYSLVMPGLVESFSAEIFLPVVLGIARNADAIEEKIGGGDSL